MSRGRRPQPWPIRLTHWVNVPALVVMAMSGLQILRAYPYFGPQGAQYDWVPLQGWDSPSWMRAGGWLAGARHLHFAFMWLFMGNAVVYVVYLARSGEWRRRFFWPPRDARPAVHQFLRYLRIRKDVVEVDLYNGLQRFAYTGAFVLALLSTLSGLAIWKPVSLHRLCWLMGGYDRARVIHFFTLLGLMAFVVVHLVMVVVHWRDFPQMITGGKRVPIPGEPTDAATAEPKMTNGTPEAPKSGTASKASKSAGKKRAKSADAEPSKPADPTSTDERATGTADAKGPAEPETGTADANEPAAPSGTGKVNTPSSSDSGVSGTGNVTAAPTEGTEETKEPGTDDPKKEKP